MIPKRVDERLIKSVPRFQQVLKTAKDRDVNETDTLSIIKDIFAEIFGYDKYMDLTSEYSVRGTFCDLAIKFDNKIEFLVEAKAIGID
ncbi:MAG: restriction endonuclease subunit R, partial [Acidobacteriota bacterium]|nr:restriction endonuclease subunit R [Acidobacteriota bacterium]